MSDSKLKIEIGVLDKVEKCEQPPFVVDFSSENLAIFGNKFTGKTTLLKNIILKLHNEKSINARIILLDFSKGLSEYSGLPLVFGYFSGENEESIKRCTNEVVKVLNSNKANSTVMKPHCILIVDGLDDLFLEGKYERHQEIFSDIVKKGLENNTSVIFTSYHTASGVIRLLQFFKKVVAFELPLEKYQDLFTKKIEKPIPIPGRGVANQGDNAYEFQAYFPFLDKDDNVIIENDIIAALKNQSHIFTHKFEKIKSFSGELNEDNFQKLFPSAITNKFFFAGVDYTKFEPVSFNLKEAGVIALYGTNFEDKLSIIKRIIQYAKRIEPTTEIHIWDDSRLRFVESLKGTIIKRINNSKEFINIFRSGLYDDFTNREEAELHSVSSARLTIFTIFIIQSSRFFDKTPGGEGTQLPLRMHDFLQYAVDKNMLFIFTNIKPLPQSSMIRDYFNGYIKHAFITGDIFHFIETRGRSSVFGELDPYELKQDFSRTIAGDGFYLDDESDYPQKLRFIIPNN